MNPDPSHFKGDNLPVESVGWEDAVEFCDRLSHAGKTYRLPTEAEWEYVCRAMTTGPYAGKLDSMGWYYRNSRDKTHPVGTKQPNGFGLYDMHGSVFEWCMDAWNETYDGAPADGTTWTAGDVSKRVLRGGCWNGNATTARSAYRFNFPPFLRLNYIGFRVVASAWTP